KLFFVNNSDSTGKSLLFKVLLSYVRSQSKIALPVVSSGILALILSDRSTAHSRFKILLNADINSTCNILFETSQSNLL
ncbi:hypothetical protein F4703DRAFT_1744008, partial [Phycomyces blakesleeanus]